MFSEKVLVAVVSRTVAVRIEDVGDGVPGIGKSIYRSPALELTWLSFKTQSSVCWSVCS